MKLPFILFLSLTAFGSAKQCQNLFPPSFSSVYTMTNQPDGNEILVYSHDETSGRLEYVSAVSSNGIGHGFQDGATDAALDSLDGQGSLAVSGNCLLA
eukprot:2150788-Ditylum_brightwellii.AAC.1